jgi:flagellar M-ring protein FliF
MLSNLPMPLAAQQLVERVGGPRQATILAAGLGIVLLILGLARWATSPTWVPVYTNLPLESVTAITERLGEEAIPYRLEAGGSELRVASTDLARARVALAGGGLPSGGRPGLELFDQPAWGMTDFTQRINYRRALEGELERTIGKMENVQSAQVHLALEETGGFRRDTKPGEASVVLRLRGGRAPSPDVVQGIAHLVSGSVDGIEAGKVTVIDHTGRLLSSAWEANSPAAMASRELAMRSEIEKYLETKAEQIVAQVVGPGNARVQVSAEINFDRVERTTESVDPDRQVLASEQRSEIIPGAEGGAGSTSVQSTYLNSRTLETFAGAVGNIRRMSAAVVVSDRTSEGANGVTWESRSPEELARIQQLVHTAIGLDEIRGDAISVISVPFGSLENTAARPVDVVEVARQLFGPGLMLLAIVFAFIIGLRLVKGLNQMPAGVGPAGLAEGSGQPALPAPGEDTDLRAGALLAPTLAGVARGKSLRDQVLAQIDEQPEASLQLVRAWLKEA